MPAAAASSTRQRRLMTPLRIRYTQHRVRRMPPNSRALRLPVRVRQASTAAVARYPVPQAQVKGHGQAVSSTEVAKLR